MTEVDLVQTDEHYYRADPQPAVRTFTAYSYVAVDGIGAPNGPTYTAAVQKLYGAAFGAKAAASAAGHDFVVPVMEGLWWVEPDLPPMTVPQDQWHWKLLIRIPEVVTADMVTGASFEQVTEGEAIQVPHRGPFSTEPEILARKDRIPARSCGSRCAERSSASSRSMFG
ncbi:GyrI-like domain-containing protein [Nocardia sp. CNY236]|uniref:GyrI-like domain-containing protein n=1 Tax=Nocardia sp. CNY236 TaxID=1169152 RepID=UPI000420B634|nr:GyrI-like domain-containing protein [Nocardia sp. CNY236]